MNWEAMAVVGRIARAHGIRGQVIVNPETDFPEERFQVGAELFVNRAPQAAIDVLTVTSVRFHRGRPIVGLSGVTDMNTAVSLAGVELRIPVDRLARLPEGAFYHHDLIGCAVETSRGVPVGSVTAVESGAGGSRIVVKVGGGEVIVPLVDAICPTIDPVGKRIVIDPPEGLLELNVRGA